MNSIPDCVDAISRDWLTQVLDRKVTSCRVEETHSGTTGRAVLSLEYGHGVVGPDRLFVKLPPTGAEQQQFVISSGMGRREAKFYQQLSNEVPLRVPRCFHAEADDGTGEQYIMLLEHLEDGGCTFRNASKRYSLGYVRSVLAAFARLHATYWDSARFQTDLQWVEQPVQHPIGEQLVARALKQYGGEMPSVFTATAEMYLADADAIHRLWNEGVPTLIHGDVHDGNLFFDGETPGFLDWALVARGPAMRDVGYFLAGTLSPQDQQLHHLDMLDYYRDQLQENGVSAPPREELLLQYRSHAVYVWVGATATLAMGGAWQATSYTQRSLERLHLALEHLDAIAVLRASV